MLHLDEVEESIVHAFQQFVIKLNEDQLGPVIVQLVKWAHKASKEESHPKINMHRQIILYKALSGVVEVLGEYAVPFIKLHISNTVETLGALIKDFKSLKSSKVSGLIGKKRPRIESEAAHMLESDTSDGQGHTMLKLLIKICENLTVNFRSDSGAFIQGDIFELLAEPLVAELVALSSLGKHFSPFVEDTVKPLVFEMVDRINNDTLWIRFNNAILMKTRTEYPWAVREAALKVVEHMFTKMGERYLVVLNDTLPFLSESLEDEHQDVELAAKSIVKRIETLTGESIQDYLK